MGKFSLAILRRGGSCAGTTYEQFISSMHLPSQLAQVRIQYIAKARLQALSFRPGRACTVALQNLFVAKARPCCCSSCQMHDVCCAQVDPIVASFCGGAVGVLSTLLVVEVNNKDRQAAQRCVYCEVSSVGTTNLNADPLSV